MNVVQRPSEVQYLYKLALGPTGRSERNFWTRNREGGVFRAYRFTHGCFASLPYVTIHEPGNIASGLDEFSRSCLEFLYSGVSLDIFARSANRFRRWKKA